MKISETEKKVNLVKSKGFKDAQIVAFNNGQLMPIKSAVKLEWKSLNSECANSNAKRKDCKSKSKKLSIKYVKKDL